MGNIVSNGNGSGSGCGGDKYKKTLYFDPEASSNEIPGHYIHDSDLRDEITKVCDTEKSILSIEVWKNLLELAVLSQKIFYHTFIILESKGYWWSLEKNTEGVTKQRSKRRSFVKEKYKRKNRYENKFCKLDLIIKAKGKGTIKELIDHIY